MKQHKHHSFISVLTALAIFVGACCCVPGFVDEASAITQAEINAMQNRLNQMSQQMKKLEYKVGLPLLVRYNKGMMLTPAGELFAEKMEQAKKLEKEALLLARQAGERSERDSKPGKKDKN